MSPLRIPLALACSICLLVASPARSSITAHTADDVCAPEANPCIVTDEVDIEPNSTLDFGQRELRIENGGVLDFGEGEAVVRCGKLVVDVDGEDAAIRLTDTTPNLIARGSRIEAVGQCSEKPRSCLTDSDCSLFECGGRRCENAPARTCTGAADCDLGSCEESGRCSGFATQRCSSNEDCQAGPCRPEQTCVGANDYPVACTTNADCQLGTCSDGDGSIDLGGTTEIDVVAYNEFAILAASDVRVRSPILVEGDETRINVETGFGDIVLDAPIESGGERGTILLLLSGGDTTINAPIVANGQSQGGWIVAIADKYLTVRNDLTATSADPNELLGAVHLESGEDLRIETGTAEDPIEIRAGSADVPGNVEQARAGGEIRMISGRDLYVDKHSSLDVNGNASSVVASASRDLSFDGTISGSSNPAEPIAPSVTIASGGGAYLRENVRVEISGEQSETRGDLTVTAAGTLDIRASIEVHGASAEDNQPISVSGCSVRVGPEADVRNATTDGPTLISATNLLEIEPGAQWHCDGCTNLARVRSDTERRIDGDVDPAIVYEADDSLEPCGWCVTSTACDDGDACTIEDACRGDICKGRRDAECGDCGSSTIEWGEDCDDGDEGFLPGEACSADCQWVRCGHPTGSTGMHPKTTDALFSLRTSVGLQTCALAVCDASQSGAVEVGDALLVLRAAVGLESVICPLPAE